MRFLEQDIRRDLPDRRFDLILCRNVAFTYFEEPLQVVIARRLVEVLVPDGLLLLGSHETLPQPVLGIAQECPWLFRRQTG